MDVQNSRYNPKGAVEPTVYKIPAQPNTYTFVSLFSVFTHMHEQEILHYMSEFNRVLRKGGKVVATVFLYSEERKQQAIDTGYGQFEYNDHTRIKDKKDPLFAIVYEEKWFVDNIVSKSGLSVMKIIYGTALGDPNGRNTQLHGKTYPHLFQDMLVLAKK